MALCLGLFPLRWMRETASFINRYLVDFTLVPSPYMRQSPHCGTDSDLEEQLRVENQYMQIGFDSIIHFAGPLRFLTFISAVCFISRVRNQLILLCR